MSQVKETACPDCGEMVRINSLRCWNCGAFMSKGIEEKFLELQSKPQEIIYSQLPEGEISAFDEDEDFELSVPSSATMNNSAVGSTSSASAEPETFSLLPDDFGTPPEENPATQKSAAAVEETPAPEPGQDDLLNIALRDEKELRKRRRERSQRGGMVTPGGGMVIFCPYGCRIEVREQHRGMQGKCPKCQAPFIVPIDPPNYKSKKSSGDDQQSAGVDVGGFDVWLTDLHLHAVNPEKLKLKADSLLKDFSPIDFAFSKDKVLAAVYGKKSGGLFGGGGGSKEDLRAALKTRLQEGKPIADIDLAEKFEFSPALLSQLKVVQPAASRTESIFHGVPVFGEGRIAVQLPPTSTGTEVHYVSMGLTQFWKFRDALKAKYGLEDFGTDHGIPADHKYLTYRCQFLEIQIKALDNLKYYQMDDSAKLDVIGYQCGKCQATVSAQGRDQHQLGGKTAKGIAKAKCPKCGNKMGENPLYDIQTQPAESSDAASN